MRNLRRAAVTSATVLLAGLTLSACGQAPTADIGACLNSDVLQGEISSLPTVGCDTEHDSEVYHKFNLPEGDYPGASEVDDLAQDGCINAFEPYVGVGYAESELWATYLTPLEASWNRDREVICIVQSEEPLTGTMKGANR